MILAFWNVFWPPALARPAQAALYFVANTASSQHEKTRCGVPSGFCGDQALTPENLKNQYIFLGNCMLRTRLWWRLTAAAFLRLRSAVGFS